MFLKTFVLLISALSFTLSQQMTCTYISPSYNDRLYQCDLSINNPYGLDDAASIGGIHVGSYIDPNGNQVSTFNDSSVNDITVYGNTKNMPSTICRQFPNVEYLTFYQTNVEIVSDTKCSKVTFIRLSYNFIKEVTTDLCQFQPALEWIYLNSNYLKVIPNVIVKSCTNLLFFYINYNQISTISSTFFASTPKIQQIGMSGNPITSIPDGLFNGLTELTNLDIDNLLITDLPLNIFPETNKIRALNIENNKLTQYRPEWFKNLKSLAWLKLNGIQLPIPATFFKPLPLLEYIFMENCNISVVPSQWFSTVPLLWSMSLHGNYITEIPDATFATTTALTYLVISNNKLKTIRSKWFSNATLQNIVSLNMDNNEVNAIDPLFFQQATNLREFSLTNNKCYTGPKITDFVAKRSTYMPGFKTCIDNFGFI